MKYVESFQYLASRRTDELVITSAGNSGQAWWTTTRDSDNTFYLDASMSLSTLFASGMACALPKQKFWAFMGDGAFCMNPGMLMVERQMNLSNMVHILVSNRAYGATSNANLPNGAANDYGAIARSFGIERVFVFDKIEDLQRDFDKAMGRGVNAYTFVVLEVEPFTAAEQKLEQPPFDGPELKYRFGRTLERMAGIDIFGYKI
ncbi:MAG: thiamine pyrophosphate-dependent enzyme [Burkholderiales bacterium]